MRKTSTITLMDGGESKRFKITQMSATKAERWLFKFVLLLGGGTDMGALKNIENDPTSLLTAVADKPYEKVQELLDDLLTCVCRIHDGGIETQLTPENVDGFIEEMGTLMKLRVEAFKANSFFPKADENESEGLNHSADNVLIRRKA